jgi:hypothetical protein
LARGGASSADAASAHSKHSATHAAHARKDIARDSGSDDLEVAAARYAAPTRMPRQRAGRRAAREHGTHATLHAACDEER